MATSKQQENMLLTEHFTWPPISLIDEIINTINEVLYRCTNILDTELSSIDPSVLGFADRAAAENHAIETDPDSNPIFPEAKLEIEEGTLKLETLVENAVDKNFDKLEIWTLRNVFCLDRKDEELGRWIRLGHYENISPPPKGFAITPESLHTLRRKLQETQKLHAALLAEKTRNEAQIQRLRSLLQPDIQKLEPRSETSPSESASETTNAQTAPFAFLTHTPTAQALGIQSLPLSTNVANPPSSNLQPPQNTSNTTTNPLTTHTQFTTSQLPYLRTLLANLRPHLATTALPAHREGSREGSREGAREELAKERKVYIESQSKRVLEKRGVDTRDGVEGPAESSSNGSGRGTAEEVRGLEGVVQVLAVENDVKGTETGREVGEKAEEMLVDENPDAMDLSQ